MKNTRYVKIAETVAGDFPRLSKIKEIKSTDSKSIPITVWYVDGQYVRTYLDEEFTNFGQHYKFNFIPESEFWIDNEGNPDEADFFIEHLLVEHKIMADGGDYGEAITEADKAEMAMRRKEGDIGAMTDTIRKIVTPAKAKVRLLKTLEDGVQVWLVNGRMVRSVLDIDFTEGGHEYVYEFVPEGEVWIDDDISWGERPLVILHELHERNRMKEGLPYSKAHAESSALELHCRRNPDELHGSLAEEGWA